MTKTNNTTPSTKTMAAASIPFDGFYDSEINWLIDSHIEGEIDYYYQELHKEITSDNFDINFDKVFEQIARDYTECFPMWLNRVTEGAVSNDFEIEFTGLYRAHDYSRSRDIIEANIPLSVIQETRAWIAEYYEPRFRAYVYERFTPRSGWIPFLDSNLVKWGPVESWEPRQYRVMFEFINWLASEADEYDDIDRFYCEVLDSTSERIYDALWQNWKINEPAEATAEEAV